MTAQQWVRDNNANAPRELLRSMTDALAEAMGTAVAAQIISGCRTVARKVAAGGCVDRSRALDLLTLDALMTSAMESAAAVESSCESAAGSLLSVISEAATIE